MDTVYIIGVGMIRFGKYPDETVRTMAEKALNRALEDAGLQKTDLQAAYFSNTVLGHVRQPALHPRAGGFAGDGHR
jgi:acetyl-CoA acyltransferase